jgi:hypothetical protein
MYVNCSFLLMCTQPKDGLIRPKHIRVLTIREIYRIYLDGDLHLNAHQSGRAV